MGVEWNLGFLFGNISQKTQSVLITLTRITMASRLECKLKPSVF